MDDIRSRGIVAQLQKKWAARVWLSLFIVVVAGTMLLSAIAIQIFHTGWIISPLVFIVLFVILYFFNYKKITTNDVSAYLDRTVPALQESTGLLLKPSAELNFLEKLQVQKVESELSASVSEPRRIRLLVKQSLGLLAISLIGSFILYLWPIPGGSATKAVSTELVKENKLPQIREVSVSIVPPAYTGKKQREQDRFNISAEEGAQVAWHITTTASVDSVLLLFNDKTTLVLRPSDSTHTVWRAGKQVMNPGFYQVVVAGSQSELYRVEMIRDLFPAIAVRSPKPSSVIEPGQQPRTQLEVVLSDDYAIKNTSINATIASGNGEAVKFRKQQMIFTDFVAGGKQYQFKKLIDLGALGMKPGDELYFYISATDSHEQEKKSDIYIVRIEDTTQLMSLEGLANGLDIKPEFFRSQRQIIIETEQLLKDRDTMRVEVFNERSNELGVDQKLLRLRYGKFLGEETNVEIGKDHDHDEGSGHNAEAGNAQQMMDEVAHKHDNAEDAGFFDAQTKKQLKATLDEMWKAELQLRTMKPRDALPFEYKALKLLKELQQQSRVYVAKTGSRTTPLKPEKRLTGELDKIIQPVQQQTFKQAADDALIQRKALGILEQVKNNEILPQTSLELLEEAGIQLGNKAAEDPAAYLAAFEAFRRILNHKQSANDISLAGSAFQKMIQSAPKLPRQGSATPDKKLSQQYFINLNRANE